MGYRYRHSGYSEGVETFTLCFLLFIAGFFTFGIAWIGLFMVALGTPADTHSSIYKKNKKYGRGH